MYLRLMQQADRLGSTACSLNEHHQTPFAMSPSPNLLGRRPRRRRRRTPRSSSAATRWRCTTRRPASPRSWRASTASPEGRLIAGMVFGTPMDTSFTYGMPPIELRERFHEARELIIRGVGRATSRSRSTASTPSCATSTCGRGPSSEQPPIWVPGSGSRRDVGARHRGGLLLRLPVLLGHGRGASRSSTASGTTATQHGGTMNPHRMAFTQVICCRGHRRRRPSASTPTRSSTSTGRTRCRRSSPTRPATTPRRRSAR